MTKYYVEFIAVKGFNVEAESEEEAESKAMDKLERHWFNDSSIADCDIQEEYDQDLDSYWSDGND